MSGEQLTGQDTPVVSDEVQTLTSQVTEGTTEAQTDGADGGKEVPAPKTFTQAELDEIVQREKAKAAARAERKAFRDARQQLQQQPRPPEREQFRDDEAFNAAQLEHLAEQKAKQLIEQRQKAEQQERVQEAFLEKAEKAAERYPDFHAVISNPNLPINETMAEFIVESDLGDDVAYHLGKNPAKAAQIAQMSHVKAVLALTRLATELASKPKATPSKAPDPIRPVGQRGAPSSSTLPSDDDDIETWMRKDRELQRRR